MTARAARAIRKRSQAHSQNRNGLGVSELFLASSADASAILAACDTRLKLYLLGFDEIPAAPGVRCMGRQAVAGRLRG